MEISKKTDMENSKKTDMENRKHYKFEGYDKDMNKRMVPKKAYPNEIEAQIACYELNLKPHNIHKIVCYKCPTCGKWHLGHHSGKQLTEDDRSKIRKQYEKFKILHRINKY
jgi:hypothetical protein